MHLLFSRQGTIAEANEAIDLGQSPADMLFLSTADTELSCVSMAKSLLGTEVPNLRLASLMALGHPLSVDTYVERTARYARLIVIRVIGGEGYWRYGLEKLYALAVTQNIALAVLPGDEKPDPGLVRFSTIDPKDVTQLWRYLIESGSENARNFLRYCAFLLGYSDKPAEPIILTKVGLWWPSLTRPTLEKLQSIADLNKKPVVAIIFYRALIQSTQTEPVEALIKALQTLELAPLPIFISSLKDPMNVSVLSKIFSTCTPDLVLNATGFSVSVPGNKYKSTVLEMHGNMVLQVIFSSTTRDNWRRTTSGLSSCEVAMNVALPEIDGRVLSRAVSFKVAESYDRATECNIVCHKPVSDRVEFVARLAANWITLKNKKPAQRRIAIIMANYPGRDSRLGHGVGLDTPASIIMSLRAMQVAGYDVQNLPQNGDELVRFLATGPTNEGVKDRIVREGLSVKDYSSFFDDLPQEIRIEILKYWGEAQQDIHVVNGVFALPIAYFGNTVIGIQPERAYGVDVKQAYHAPDIVPSHHYMAFYFWLRYKYCADAVVHMGKHGNLEWLPGKALALSNHCYPEIALGPLPHIYPFIVNDPGEGAQAKRRSSAIIIDHMTPPLTKAESYGPLKDMEALVDEYYEAASIDPRRLSKLKTQILDLVKLTGVDRDAGIEQNDGDDLALQKVDTFLCDLKDMQIRNGLHVFGQAPREEQLTDLLVALVRVPRGTGGRDSLHRSIARDMNLEFDPLDCTLTDLWKGKRPVLLSDMSDDLWRNTGDTVERIEKLCFALIAGTYICPKNMKRTALVLENIERELRPLIVSSGEDEIKSLLLALDGCFVPPGPSGAPTRGRSDVLPVGRNFFSVDTRAVPTPVAWDLGIRSAELLIIRYVQDYGEWPTSFGLTAWGTSNMRTGGDDIAQALALIGVKPVWDMASRRVIGYEIIPLTKLDRPRVDVVLRISGFFRDAFPEQLSLLDQAFRMIGNLDEADEDNPIAMRMRRDARNLESIGFVSNEAHRQAGHRIFGARPGVYGNGIQELIDSGDWNEIGDLGRAWMVSSSYAYGAHEAVEARTMLENRLNEIQAIVQNQDNREHDLLDSSEYYAFEGGMAAAVAYQSGERLPIYHNDLSRPERPVIRTLEEEIGRTLRGRVVNPKWIKNIMQHGYRGTVEMAATVSYLCAFAATTGAVADTHFNAIYDAYLGDDKVRCFLREKNPTALREIAAHLDEAVRRNFWMTYSNSAHCMLYELTKSQRKFL